MRGAMPEAIRGVVETLAVMAAFVAFGLGWAALEHRAGAEGGARPPDPGSYPGWMAERTGDDPVVWLVDGFNVLHAGVLGGRDRSEWWTAARRQEVLDAAFRLDAPGAEVWVVFDGPEPAPPGEEPGRVRTVFAPSADDWLLARVRASPAPERTAVVTADRRLAERARRRGAQVISPGDFLARCAG